MHAWGVFVLLCCRILWIVPIYSVDSVSSCCKLSSLWLEVCGLSVSLRRGVCVAGGLCHTAHAESSRDWDWRSGSLSASFLVSLPSSGLVWSSPKQPSMSTQCGNAMRLMCCTTSSATCSTSSRVIITWKVSSTHAHPSDNLSQCAVAPHGQRECECTPN